MKDARAKMSPSASGIQRGKNSEYKTQEIGSESREHRKSEGGKDETAKTHPKISASVGRFVWWLITIGVSSGTESTAR
jgi:hypothetical protein